VRGLLKRNVWESVKRARNRLDRAGTPWEIAVHADAASVRDMLPELRRLHAARAAMAGARVHPDALADPLRRAFFTSAVARMAAAGRAEVLALVVDGTPVAAQLVLRSRSASYLALSGLDPQWWSVGPVTLLQYTAMERALERGDTEVNLSVGPDISKLRWSERVVQHPEFVVCGPRARSRVLLSGYAALAAVAAVHREAARHTVREQDPAASGGEGA
jgi:CelD/BcsL family acetyltransferase involved in cellulose biosynthesis